MQAGKRKDEDAETDASPFVGIRKNVVVREARQFFNEQQINPNKCALVLTKILYLLIQGETFTSEEATEVFFAVTKLFQSPDQHLRRMIYVVIKEMKIGSDESLIVVSCLSKDMTSKIDLFRANSIRVLAKIMDAPMVSQVERFLKQAIVDKNPFIVASTLCAGQHLFPLTPDVIKRWTNEVQEALQSKHKMVQYHALASLYKIKQQDKLALTKVVTALVRNPPQGPMAQCLQIRIISSLLEGSPNNPQPELMKFMIDSLHNKNFMVMYEAARNICRMESLTAVQVAPAISVLQEFLASPIPAQRFAAVRTLSEVVVRFPLIVTPCSSDLEHLITDNNRSIATLAITTLLKTGVESNVDRLMKSISGFMSDISDEFKIVLVDAIKTLCLKFPHKHQTLMNFLASALREEGGYKYKKSIVESMLTIINEIKETKDTGKDAMDSGLEHFCEFIEDCEFPELSVRILHLLGDKGPKTSNPAKYIRFIFNRVILETASVRSAAVSSLAKFGAAVPALTASIIVLLKRCLGDNDDEVRDRAIFHLDLLQNDREQANAMLFQRTPFVPLHQLEASLQNYIDKSPAETFSVTKHLIDVKEVEDKKPEDTQTFAKPAGPTTTAPTSNTTSTANNDLELFNSIPELKALGKVFKTCAPVELTETETEYVVTCIKHILPNHVVFQFHIINNMEEHQLENVTVEMESENDAWQEELSIPEEKIRTGTPGTAFVVFTRPSAAFQSGSLSCTLKFTVKEVSGDDVSTMGSEDEYQLEEMEVTESDFMKPGEATGLVEFRRQWEALGDTVEVVKKYSLGLDSLQSAVNAVIDLLGMNGVENSSIVPDNVRSHAVNLIGTFYGDIPVLCRAGFMLDANHGVTLKIAVRSQNAAINNMLTSAIR